MKCGYCGHQESRVVDSRDSTQDGIRRRRECLGCGRRFTTYEFLDREELVVIKSNGERRPFDSSKIRAGIQKACQKRSVADSDIEQLLQTIEQQIYNSLDQEITTKDIGVLVMGHLKKLDQVAYVRFASVYQKFGDVDSFVQFISRIED